MLHPLLIVALSLLGGCQQLGLENPFYEAPRPTGKPAPQLSADPLEMSARDINFAQLALNKLGYQAGDVDGLWGPRSAQAIRQFEVDYGLPSAGGNLSELNLYTLQRVSGIDKNSVPGQRAEAANGISAKLDADSLRKGIPQLVITEQAYPLLARANPYSETITMLPPGTGIYVLNLQAGWYEVESTEELRGYIRAE